MKFCPECGEKLGQKVVAATPRDANKNNSIGIHETKGDILGIGFSGSGNVTSKEVTYTVQGNVLNFNISDSSVSKEFIEQLQKMLDVPTQLESQTSSSQSNREDNMIMLEETSTTKQQISKILDEVDSIEKKAGTQIKEIKAGDFQISHTQLSLREILLKDNEHYFKKEYDEAIRWYDKALQIDPNAADVWYNKGLALDKLRKYEDATKCFDKVKQLREKSEGKKAS